MSTYPSRQGHRTHSSSRPLSRLAFLIHRVVDLHQALLTTPVGADRTGPLGVGIVTSAGVQDIVEVLGNIARVDIKAFAVL